MNKEGKQPTIGQLEARRDMFVRQQDTIAGIVKTPNQTGTIVFMPGRGRIPENINEIDTVLAMVQKRKRFVMRSIDKHLPFLANKLEGIDEQITEKKEDQAAIIAATKRREEATSLSQIVGELRANPEFVTNGYLPHFEAQLASLTADPDPEIDPQIARGERLLREQEAKERTREEAAQEQAAAEKAAPQTEIGIFMGREDLPYRIGEKGERIYLIKTRHGKQAEVRVEEFANIVLDLDNRSFEDAVTSRMLALRYYGTDEVKYVNRISARISEARAFFAAHEGELKERKAKPEESKGPRAKAFYVEYKSTDTMSHEKQREPILTTHEKNGRTIYMVLLGNGQVIETRSEKQARTIELLVKATEANEPTTSRIVAQEVWGTTEKKHVSQASATIDSVESILQKSEARVIDYNLPFAKTKSHRAKGYLLQYLHKIPDTKEEVPESATASYSKSGFSATGEVFTSPNK